MAKHKSVHLVAYQFDSLPGHVRVTACGAGSTIRIAIQRAVGRLFSQSQLRHKRIGSFKLAISINERTEPTPAAPPFVPCDISVAKGGAA